MSRHWNVTVLTMWELPCARTVGAQEYTWQEHAGCMCVLLHYLSFAWPAQAHRLKDCQGLEGSLRSANAAPSSPLG